MGLSYIGIYRGNVFPVPFSHFQRLMNNLRFGFCVSLRCYWQVRSIGAHVQIPTLPECWTRADDAIQSLTSGSGFGITKEYYLYIQPRNDNLPDYRGVRLNVTCRTRVFGTVAIRVKRKAEE